MNFLEGMGHGEFLVYFRYGVFQCNQFKGGNIWERGSFCAILRGKLMINHGFYFGSQIQRQTPNLLGHVGSTCTSTIKKRSSMDFIDELR